MKELRPTSVGPIVVDQAEVKVGWNVLSVVHKDGGYAFNRAIKPMPIASFSMEKQEIVVKVGRDANLKIPMDRALLVSTDHTDPLADMLFLEAMKGDGIYEYAKIALREFAFKEVQPEVIRRQAIVGVAGGKYYPRIGSTVQDRIGRRWVVKDIKDGKIIVDGFHEDIEDRKDVEAPQDPKAWDLTGVKNWDEVFSQFTDPKGGQIAAGITVKNFRWSIDSRKPLCHINHGKVEGGHPYIIWTPEGYRKPTLAEFRAVMFMGGVMDLDTTWV